MNGNVTQIYRHMNELLTDTCEQEAHPASPSITVEQLRLTPARSHTEHQRSETRDGARTFSSHLVTRFHVLRSALDQGFLLCQAGQHG